MADQKTTDAALTNANKTYYEKKFLEDFGSKAAYYTAAPVKVKIPVHGGKTIEFTRYRKIKNLTSDNSDEFTATQLYASADVVTATLHERDGYIKLSRLADLTQIGGIDAPMRELRKTAVRTLDVMVRNDIGMMVADVASATSLNYQNMYHDDTSNTLHSTGITARVWSHDNTAGGDRFPMRHNKTRIAQSSLVTSFAKSAMTFKTLQDGSNYLFGKDIDTLEDGNYHAIGHPDVFYQLRTQSGFKGWFSPTTSEPAKRLPGEQGTLAGVKFMTTTLAYKFTLSGDTLSTASGDLYCTLLFGAEAYGTAEISGKSGGVKGYNFIIKTSGEGNTADPTNMIKTAGFSITNASKVLNKSAGVWLLTTSVV